MNRLRAGWLSFRRIQLAAQKADRLPAASLIAGQSVLDQRDEPARRLHVHARHRCGRRAERILALAVDDLVGDVVAPRHWRYAG